MDFSYSEKVIDMQKKLTDFMEEHVYPNEKVYDEQLNQQENRWATVPPIKIGRAHV